MPRTGRRRSLTIAAALLAVLAAPAAAQAATYTVKARRRSVRSAPTCSCGSMQDAAADAAIAGDVFNVAPGNYARRRRSTSAA